MSYCSVKSCNKKSSDHKNLSFFSFPQDLLIRKQWIKNCGLKHLLDVNRARSQKNNQVCADHFEDKMFLKPWTRNRLIYNAVPTFCRKATLSMEPKKLTVKEEQKFETESNCPTCSRPITEKKPITIPSDDNVTTYIKIETSEAGSSEIPLQLMSVDPENGNVTTYIKSETSEAGSSKIPFQLMIVDPENGNVTTYIKSETSEAGSSELPLQLMSVDPGNYNVTTHKRSETSEADSSKIPLEMLRVDLESMKLLKEIESADQHIKDLKRKLAVANQKLDEVNTVEQMLKLCKIHLKPSLLLLIQNYLDNRSKKLENFSYNDQILELAKALYLLCPANLYQNLQSILSLPPLSTLKPTLNSIEIHPADSDLNN